MSTPAEMAVLGMGAMGRAVLGSLRTRLPEAHVTVYERPERVSLLQEELAGLRSG